MLTLARTFALLLALGGAHGPPRGASAQDRVRTVDVVQVIDADTLRVERAGRVETLRLLSVDTEEKITGEPPLSRSKPQTVFGEETALWARELFDGLRAGEARARVELAFPGEVERCDAFGRLLCHVLLADGRDYNVMLVELGKSPYFTKYGYDELRHADLARAEASARARELGIWNPATNRARTPGAPEAVRPYERLLPWWHARAEAVEAFRAAARAAPERCLAAEDPAGLEAALARDSGEVEVFGEIERFFEEPDGSLTVRFAGPEPERALRVALTAADRHGPLETLLRASTAEFRQNYLWVRGKLARGERGLALWPSGPSGWRLAGPEPGAPGW
jgi:endonuclease YncB( thermonuclease family)